eukprot:jgi/Mesvir1/21761/Mv26175-RA.1
MHLNCRNGSVGAKRSARWTCMCDMWHAYAGPEVVGTVRTSNATMQDHS